MKSVIESRAKFDDAMSRDLEDMLLRLVNTQDKQTYHGRALDLQNIASQIYDDYRIIGVLTSAAEIEDFLEDLYDAKFPINNISNFGKQMHVDPLVRNAVQWIRKYCKSNYNMRI